MHCATVANASLVAMSLLIGALKLQDLDKIRYLCDTKFSLDVCVTSYLDDRDIVDIV